MDASCKIQGSIHSFFLVHNMCPELWVHIRNCECFFLFKTLENYINRGAKRNVRRASARKSVQELPPGYYVGCKEQIGSLRKIDLFNNIM